MLFGVAAARAEAYPTWHADPEGMGEWRRKGKDHAVERVLQVALAIAA